MSALILSALLLAAPADPLDLVGKTILIREGGFEVTWRASAGGQIHKGEKAMDATIVLLPDQTWLWKIAGPGSLNADGTFEEFGHAHHWLGGAWSSPKPGVYRLTPQNLAGVLVAVDYQFQNTYGHGAWNTYGATWWAELKARKDGTVRIKRGEIRAHGYLGGADAFVARMKMAGKGVVDA